MKIKTLKWEPLSSIETASTPFGSYWVDKDYWGYCFTEYYDEDQFTHDGIEDGKRKAEENWLERISDIFEE